MLKILVWERTKVERYTPPNFHSNFALFITNDDPRIVREAMDSQDDKLWKKSMAATNKNEAWDIIQFLVGGETIGRKWVFKKKLNAEGRVEKYKAQLVAKGYSQVDIIDFNDIFSLIANLTSSRFLLFVIIIFYFEVRHMNVKITSVLWYLEEEIYMKKL